ncbi:hypothetical protein D3C72_2374780 [compost metagenome]
MAFTSKVVRPIEDSTKFRKNAASVIRMIIPVVRSVASKARPSIVQVSTRLQAHSRVAATTPSAADSLAVAMPP